MAEKVVVQLVLDTSRYTSGASNAARSTAKIQTAADKTSKSVGSLGSTALKAGAALGAAFAAKAALDFAKSSIAAFSNLEESINAVEVSFGDASEGVLALGENSAEQFGLSTRAVNEAAVAMSAFADKIDEADPADAFENVLQRATDFASVMNIEVEESLILFRSGLAGESEPLRKFGIDVSAATVNLVGLEAGLGGANGKLDEGEKVQARYLAIMQQTEKTAGDFANTADGLANSQRILSAKWEEAQVLLGAKLAPAMTTLLQAGTDLIPVFVLVVDVFGAVIKQATPLIELFGEGATLLGLWAASAGDAGDEGGFLSARMEDVKSAAFAIIDPVGTLAGGFQELRGHFDGTADAAADLQAAWDNVDPSAFDGDLAALGLTLGNVTMLQEAAISPTARYKQVVRAAGAFADSAAAAEERRAAGIRSVLSAQAEAADPLLRLLRSQDRLVASQERLNELQEDAEATAADQRDAILDVAEAQVDLESASINVSGRVGEGVDALFRFGEQAGLTNEQLAILADTIDTFPTSIEVDLTLQAKLSIGDIGKILRDTIATGLRRGEPVLVTGLTTTTPTGPTGQRRDDPILGSGLTRRRHGGPVAANEPVLVGEGGLLELFIPDSAGRIIPNKAFGEQSIIVNVNDPTTTDLAADLSAGLIAAQITQQVELLRT